MADRSVSIRLSANVSGLTAGFKTATGAAQDFATKGLASIGKNEQHINKLSNTMGAMGLAMVGAAGLAVKSFADFDQAMSNTAALGDDAAGAIDELRDAAMQAGRDTAFSAKEAALGVTELMKAGVASADVLGGGLTGALNLAAAGELEVADAARIAATTMTQFALEGKDVTTVADAFASAANNAQGSVGDVAKAMEYAGVPAAALKISMEETTGVIGLFAQSGIVGEKAGTAFRGMLVQMQKPTTQSARMMEELNLQFFDAEGRFIGMEGVAGQLQTRLVGLTDEQRGMTLATIFGSEALGAATALYNGGAESVAGWTETVSQSGYASEVAATKLDNLAGDLKILQGSFETALISMGEGADGPLRALTQGATNAVNALSEVPAGAQSALLGIVGVGGLAVLGLAGMGKLAIGINSVKTALVALNVTAKTAAITVGAIGGVLAVATIGVTAWVSANAEAKAKIEAIGGSLDSATNAITKNTREIVKNELAAEQGWWVFKRASAFDGAKILGLSLETVTDAALGNADALKAVKEATNGFQGDMEGLGDAAAAAGVGIGDYSVAQDNVRDAVIGSNESIDEAIRLAQMKAAADGSATGAQEGLASAVDGTTVAIGDATRAGESLTEAQEKWREDTAKVSESFIDLGGAYDTVIQKNTDLATSTADATESAEDSWEDYYDGVTVGFSDYMKELEAQVQAQSDWEKNMILLSGNVSRTTLDYLKEMGVKGAPLVAELVTRSGDELSKFSGLVEENVGAGTTQFAETLDNAGPVIAWAAAKLGDGAAKEIAAKLEAGTSTVAQIMAEYGMTISAIKPNVVVTIDTWQAEMRIKTFKEQLARDDFVITAEVRKESGYYSGRATGGAIHGPGTGTSDDVPIMASNGEHMLTADDVNDVGGQAAVYRMRQMIQAGRLHLAGGGEVWSPNVARYRGRMNINPRLPDVSPSGGGMGDGSGSGSSLVAFGRRIQAMGFSVAEHPAFGGVRGRHMNGSKHYIGRAIDVNKGAGTSRAEQIALASIIGLSKSYGLNNIFMKPGHYNHAHFDFMNGGFTGKGARHEWAGNVHKGEYVLNKNAVDKYGPAMFDGFNQQRYMAGVPGSQVAPAPAPSGPTFNVTATADAPLAQHYAEQVAKATTSRLQDAMATYGIGR